MAPATTSKPLQQIQNRPRQRIVVPVIPLPYVQKRRQQEAARVKAKDEEAAVPPSVVEEVRTQTPPPPPAIEEITSPTANGSSEGQASEKADETNGPASPSELEITANAAVEEEAAAVGESEVSVKEEEEQDEPEETPKSTPSEGQSSASRSTYQMPPAFVPAQSQTNGNNITSPNTVFNGQHTMHQPHPSVSNVVFGGFPDSERSSPAPPSFTNNPPRYDYPQNQAPSGYVPPQSQPPLNGYNPASTYQITPQFPPGFYPRPEHFENHARRQMVSFGPPEGYSPSGTPVTGDPRMNFDPSTPHSFHGSQSSVANDPEAPAFYSQYPTAVISNGSNGHIDQVRVYPSVPKAIGNHTVGPAPGAFVPHGPNSLDNFDGLLYYLQQQFSDPTLADYTLELRYSDDHAEPVRIPGHNLMFARSSTLKNLMTAQARESNNDGQTVRTLLIESNDRFLCSDGFWMAAHRLYGAPLMEVGLHGAQTMVANAESVGPPAARFDLALGYTAAGKLLNIPPVITRGMEVASQLLSWKTIEKAFDFALDGGLDAQWFAGPPGLRAASQHRLPTYGPAGNILIHHSLQFIIANFPAGFVLDRAVGEPTYNRRLPTIPQAGHNPRLSAIKFGDHPSEDNSRTVAETPITTALSKLLLNLPWDLLKYVLDSPRLGNVQGWATTALRQNVINAVIDEREKRRIKVLETPLVSNEQRKANGRDWEVVGWMEKVEKLSGKDAVPVITRSWVDFTLLGLD